MAGNDRPIKYGLNFRHKGSDLNPSYEETIQHDDSQVFPSQVLLMAHLLIGSDHHLEPSSLRGRNQRHSESRVEPRALLPTLSE